MLRSKFQGQFRFGNLYASYEWKEIMKFKKCPVPVVVAFVVVLLTTLSVAQEGKGALRGQVTDPSGAAIPAANVIMTPSNGSPIVIHSNDQGMYEFKSLPAGKYTLTVAANGFTLYE